jgi:hypothetical protein
MQQTLHASPWEETESFAVLSAKWLQAKECEFVHGQQQLLDHVPCPLQVWKGTQKASEVELQDVPVAVCALLLDSQGPKLPTVAVAAGSHIYMFQNLRPFYKFTLPAAGAHAAEESVW